MIQKRITSIRLVRLMLCFLFLAGAVAHAQTAPKLKKDGKFKAKKNKVADHTHRVETKKKHHQVDWKHHNQAENQTFSKKKKKKPHK